MSWLKDMLGSDTGKLRVLAVIPDTLDRSVLEGIAARAHWELRFSSGCEKGLAELRRHPASVIICDRDQPRCDWREALVRLAAEAPKTPIILSTTDTDDHFWLEVMERGGYDVVTRPFVEGRLLRVVLRAAVEGAR